MHLPQVPSISLHVLLESSCRLPGPHMPCLCRRSWQPELQASDTRANQFLKMTLGLTWRGMGVWVWVRVRVGWGGTKGLELLSAEHALMENKRHPIVLLSAARHFYYNAMHSDPEVTSQQRLECHLYLLKAPSSLKAELSQLSKNKEGGNMLICVQEPSFLSFLLSYFTPPSFSFRPLSENNNALRCTLGNAPLFLAKL